MPIPTLITDLSTTISSNSPAGSDTVFPDLDDYVRALSGFLASIRANSGNGWVSPYATTNASSLTSGTLPVARLDLSSPPAIGATSPSTGTFLNTLRVQGTAPELQVASAGAGQNAFLAYYNNGNAASNLRWFVFKDNGTESGSNAGSGFGINAYSDAGAYISTPLSIARSTGVVTIGNGSGIGQLNASNLASGTVPAARITSVTATAAVMSTQSGSAPSYAVRAWGNVASGGTLNAGGNVSSVRNSAGVYTITFTTAMADANYAVVVTVVDSSTAVRAAYVDSLASGSFVVRTVISSGAANDFQFMFTVVR